MPSQLKEQLIMTGPLDAKLKLITDALAELFAGGSERGASLAHAAP